jgi:hypothetical protein
LAPHESHAHEKAPLSAPAAGREISAALAPGGTVLSTRLPPWRAWLMRGRSIAGRWEETVPEHFFDINVDRFATTTVCYAWICIQTPNANEVKQASCRLSCNGYSLCIICLIQDPTDFRATPSEHVSTMKVRKRELGALVRCV